MNRLEEEMQNDLEKNRIPHGDTLDVKAYQAVFRALRKEPGYELPPDFAQQVVSRVAKKQGGFSKDYLWFAGGIFLLLVSLVGTILYTEFRFDFGFLRSMSDYRGLLIFGFVFIVFINWLDKRLLGSKQVG